MLMMLKKWWHQEDICTKEPALELAITKFIVMAMDGTLHESKYGKIEHLLEVRFVVPNLTLPLHHGNLVASGNLKLSKVYWRHG
jgi:uncharacterized tellurite resistance protein B-like protein